MSDLPFSQRQVDSVKSMLVTDEELEALTPSVPAIVLRRRFEQIGCDFDRLSIDCLNVRVERAYLAIGWHDDRRSIPSYDVHWPDGCVYRDAWEDR